EGGVPGSVGLSGGGVVGFVVGVGEATAPAGMMLPVLPGGPNFRIDESALGHSAVTAFCMNWCQNGPTKLLPNTFDALYGPCFGFRYLPDSVPSQAATAIVLVKPVTQTWAL